jgi:hypothetical protein
MGHTPKAPTVGSEEETWTRAKAACGGTGVRVKRAFSAASPITSCLRADAPEWSI